MFDYNKILPIPAAILRRWAAWRRSRRSLRMTHLDPKTKSGADEASDFVSCE
jgi:hypothetical protein